MTNFIEKHWQFVIIGIGLLIFLGAVFNWKWVCDEDGGKPFGLLALFSRMGWKKLYRILIGIIGILIMFGGLLLLWAYR